MAEEEPDVGALLIGVPGSELAEQFCERLFGPAANEAGGIGGNLIGGLIGDRISAWRQENRIRIAFKAKKRLHDDGIHLDDTKPLPIRDWPQIVEAMNNVDQEALSDMWAGLIARAMRPDRSGLDTSRFSRTISSLTEDDALLFSVLVMSEQLIQFVTSRRSRAMSTVLHLMKVSKQAADEFGESENRWFETHVTPIANSLNDTLAMIDGEEKLELAVDSLIRLGLAEFLEQPKQRHIPAVNLDAADLLRRGIDPSRELQSALTTIASAAQAVQLVQRPKNTVFSDRGGIPNFLIRATGWGNRVADTCGIGLTTEQVARLT